MLLIKHIHKCFPDQRSSSLQEHRNWNVLFLLLWVHVWEHTFASSHPVFSLRNVMSEGTELGTAAIPLRSQPQGLRVAYSSARGHGVYICMLQRKQTHTQPAEVKKHWSWRWPRAPVWKMNLIFFAGWFGYRGVGKRRSLRSHSAQAILCFSNTSSSPLQSKKWRARLYHQHFALLVTEKKLRRKRFIRVDQCSAVCKTWMLWANPPTLQV